MEFDQYKEEIISKQEQMFKLEEKIKLQQKTIEELSSELRQAELQHQQTMAQLQKQLNPTNQDALNNELKSLKNEIQAKIQMIEQKSDHEVKIAVSEAQLYQQRQYKTIKEKLEEREGIQRQQFRKQYILQLQEEKSQLEKQLLHQRHQNEEKQQEIKRIETEVLQLRQTLRQTLQESLQKNHQQAKQTKQEELTLKQMSLEQIEDQLKETEEVLQNINQPTEQNQKFHSKCAQEINLYQSQINSLQKSINGMKTELQGVVQGTIEALRNTGLIDQFYKNEQICLTAAQKRELCEEMAKNQNLVQSLVKMGQQKPAGAQLKLPSLMKKE